MGEVYPVLYDSFAQLSNFKRHPFVGSSAECSACRILERARQRERVRGERRASAGGWMAVRERAKQWCRHRHLNTHSSKPYKLSLGLQ